MEHHRKDTKAFQLRVEDTVKKLEALFIPKKPVKKTYKACVITWIWRFVWLCAILLGSFCFLLAVALFRKGYPNLELLKLEPCTDCKDQFDIAIDYLFLIFKNILSFCISEYRCIYVIYKCSPYLIICGILIALVQME